MAWTQVRLAAGRAAVLEKPGRPSSADPPARHARAGCTPAAAPAAAVAAAASHALPWPPPKPPGACRLCLLPVPRPSPPAPPLPRRCPAAKPLPKELTGELSQLVGRGCQLCQAALRADGAKVMELISRDPASFSAGGCAAGACTGPCTGRLALHVALPGWAGHWGHLLNGAGAVSNLASPASHPLPLGWACSPSRPPQWAARTSRRAGSSAWRPWR